MPSDARRPLLLLAVLGALAGATAAVLRRGRTTRSPEHPTVTCDCGQRFRATGTGRHRVLWPEGAPSSEPLLETQCPSCGRELPDRLNGPSRAVRAVVYERFRGPLSVVEVDDPQPSPDGVVVRVEATGLCRSDWHGWMGHDPALNRLPHVPGHELAGVVEAVGAEVRQWRPGARVTVPFVCACGTCEPCRGGDHQVCDRQTQPGFTHWGSFAELVALDWADVNLVALPDAVDAAAAAALGCRFATAYRAVLQVGRLRAGEWVAVHGCGGVGLSAVMIAAAAGARVVALDMSEHSLELARASGAELTLPAGADVREATGGGVHLSLDAIGAQDAIAASLAGLRKRGRHVQVGLLAHPPRVPLDLVIGRELELLGSHGMPAHAYPQMLALVAAGRLRPGDLVTREIGLEEVGDALAAMTTGGGRGVTVIRPGR